VLLFAGCIYLVQAYLNLREQFEQLSGFGSGSQSQHSAKSGIAPLESETGKWGNGRVHFVERSDRVAGKAAPSHTRRLEEHFGWTG
jgi:hypothetical protein